VTRFAVCVRPSAAATRAIAAFERPAITGVRWTEPAQWMVKVRPLGHVAADVVDQLATVLADELDGAPAVRCVAGPMTSRLGGQWLSVPIGGLADLAAVVFEVSAPIVPVTHPQPFRADLALATGRVPKELGGRPLACSWTARSLVLVADRSSPRGPRFEDVAAFPLGR
jgi:2'-5' RNA ligase